MAQAFDTFRFYLGRLGRVGTVGIVLIIAGLVFENTMVRPREAALAAQMQRNEQAQRESAPQRARASQAETNSVLQPTLAPAAAAALRRLFDAADKIGLELDQGEYRLTEAKEAHLRRYQFSLPVFGSYPEIREFIAEVLNTDSALALTSVQLRRDSIETPDLDAQLNFTLYLEPGA